MERLVCRIFLVPQCAVALEDELVGRPWLVQPAVGRLGRIAVRIDAEQLPAAKKRRDRVARRERAGPRRPEPGVLLVVVVHQPASGPRAIAFLRVHEPVELDARALPSVLVAPAERDHVRKAVLGACDRVRVLGLPRRVHERDAPLVD